jgi:hypothetical protein
MTDREDYAPPRGFAAHHRATARDPAGLHQLRDLLGLIGYSVTLQALRAWPLAKRVQAEVYAVRARLRASDNPVRVPPRPAWMPEPWRGRTVGRGVFAQRKGTVLP